LAVGDYVVQRLNGGEFESLDLVEAGRSERIGFAVGQCSGPLMFVGQSAVCVEDVDDDGLQDVFLAAEVLVNESTLTSTSSASDCIDIA